MPDAAFALPQLVRILIVEDDPLLRASLSAALAGDWALVVDAVPAAAAAMEVAAAHPFDVLLTDLDLGEGPSGAVLAHALRRQRPGVGIVVLTSYVDPRLVGAKLSQLPPGTEYVTKQSVHDLDLLRTAVVRAAMRGADPLPDVARREGSRLTDTQIETMRLIAEGLTNAEIAQRRFVTEKSVEVTITRILRALGPDDEGARNPRVRLTRAYYTLAGAAPPTGRQRV